MPARKRLAAASIAAFGLAFAVVLALGQALPSGSTADPAPSTGAAPTPTTTPTEPPTSEPAPGTTSSETPSETRPSETTSPSGGESSRSYDLSSLLVPGPAGEDDEDLRDLHPVVWRDGDEQVYLCIQVPEGFEIGSDGWEDAVGPIHCRTATRGQSLELELVRS
ncbi:hypothetical protein SAMN05660690_4309 [Geodermatophilus telluris]|uniref:Uncharacterized protein n=1 Tax=Geodermatophilus telluris TaxID=1190417 RepID=A0A1G6V268_9ACTN|nr:hypothetical protein [Geodermatophilus telluris]SDD47593.1 hypothetical protein SAMN05660690_4309 [Geodermatophilus telluris]